MKIYITSVFVSVEDGDANIYTGAGTSREQADEVCSNKLLSAYGWEGGLDDVVNDLLDTDPLGQFYLTREEQDIDVRVVANITGGCLQGSSSNAEGVSLTILDYDIHETDLEENFIVDERGKKVYARTEESHLDPEFVSIVTTKQQQ